MNFRKSKNHDGILGMTLVELLIASSIFLVIVSIAYFGWYVASNNFNIIKAKVEARQSARQSVDILTKDFMMASFIFAGRSEKFGDYQYKVPLTNVPGDNILIAIPEAATPIDSTGKYTGTYTVIGYYITPKNPPDPANPNAYSLMRREANGVTPTVPGSPATINFNNLNVKIESKMVADYVDKSNFSLTPGECGQYVDIVLGTNKRQLTISKYEPALLKLTVNLRNK